MAHGRLLERESMPDVNSKEYVVIVQCHIVKERCPGYFCEKSFRERTGGFAAYPKDKTLRMIFMTCGGCCGRALHRKLALLAKVLKKSEGMEKDKIVVQLSSCIAKENYHGPVCPHLGYLRQLIARVGLESLEGTSISEKAEKRRQEGAYSK